MSLSLTGSDPPLISQVMLAFQGVRGNDSIEDLISRQRAILQLNP